MDIDCAFRANFTSCAMAIRSAAAVGALIQQNYMITIGLDGRMTALRQVLNPSGSVPTTRCFAQAPHPIRRHPKTADLGSWARRIARGQGNRRKMVLRYVYP